MKLWVHQKSFSGEELLVNPKEFKDIKVGDILEIYHEDDDQSHLLLQVNTLKSVELPQKDIISIDQSIASLFQLRAYKDVRVKTVQVQDVALDLVELLFKDQYISRSDMWRLGKSLIGNCLYIQKKIVFSGIRAQVMGLWSRGEKVSCGAVTQETRVTFRTSTAMTYIFIQMSAEMWEFDTCGDLYMEKAVDGFMTELFNMWKKQNTNSELTIVLFSRVYYEATSIDEFPASMQTSVHIDYQGRIYQDFYRVVVLNERRDDWLPLLVTIKQLMMTYKEDVQNSLPQDDVPKGAISKAGQGNVLEAINLSLNVFDNHYVNRNFDRTGQVVVLISPGAGVFEVGKTLADITRLRMIDYGIGSDLVCLAEQPPHPVPLFIYTDANDNTKTTSDRFQYDIPQWLNYSFYLSRSQKQRQCSSTQSSFRPRCILPEQKVVENTNQLRKVSFPKLETDLLPQCLSNITEQYTSDGELDERDTDEEESQYNGYDSKVFSYGNKRNNYHETSSNPFFPSTLKTKLTADIKRWTHTFPRGITGETQQLHHKYLIYNYSGHELCSLSEMSTSSSDSSLCTDFGEEFLLFLEDTPSRAHLSRNNLKRSTACAWGITGEQAWTPYLQSGVDWKSLTSTACFPITTDYYPERWMLEAEYEEAPYNLDGCSLIEDYEDESLVKATLSNVLQELVSQRLIQDFQLVVIPQSKLMSLAHLGTSKIPLVTDQSKMEYVLSYGNTFHKISLKLDRYNVEVVKYNARNEIPTSRLAYSYQLWGVKKNQYEAVKTRVYHKPVQNDKWNLRDNYICIGKDADKEGFELHETLKFWRSRFVLLPSAASVLKKLCEQGNSTETHFDVFEERTAAQKIQLIEGFLKFMEGLNRKKKSQQTLSAKQPLQRVPSDNSSITGTPMRRISRTSGTTTPTTPQPALSITASAITNALSNLASGRKEMSSTPCSPTTPDFKDLGLMSPRSQIIMGMRDNSTGLTFLNGDNKGLPPDCFVSCDAIQWLQKTMTTQITHMHAIRLMQDMLDDGLIHSLSIDGPGTRKFLYGYYLYCIVQETNSSATTKSPWVSEHKHLYGLQDIQSTYFEVACCHPEQEEERNNNKQTSPNASGDSEFDLVEAEEKLLSPPRIVLGTCNSQVYKSQVMEIDSTKSDRVEWCHVGYHGNYHPDNAFEMELQWLTSTPSLLLDIITNWNRRAASCGFHFIPYLIDPFGFCKDISDPFRSALFIHLNLPTDVQECCQDGKLHNA
ncbi:GATOR1 complex protein DEPDC5-like isoform X2 [Amphiura filiformis]|uniref:GATOR1 complex protein DEPDC5-like isoform X2 n=1 Tax=Amphiura filiformis TaxID=82378 RepID=UPI003B21587C